MLFGYLVLALGGAVYYKILCDQAMYKIPYQWNCNKVKLMRGKNKISKIFLQKLRGSKEMLMPCKIKRMAKSLKSKVPARFDCCTLLHHHNIEFTQNHRCP